MTAREDTHDNAARNDGDNRLRGAWRLVAAREILVRARNKTFILSTLLTLLLIIGLGLFTKWMGDRETTYDIAVTGANATSLVNSAERIADGSARFRAKPAPDDAAGRAMVRDGDVDAWLHRAGDTWVLGAKGEPGSGLAGPLAQAVQIETMSANAEQAGTSLDRLTEGAALSRENLDSGGIDSDAANITALVFAILFYMASLMFGIQIANSVIEEKQSRIVEILATAIPLRQLLAGKVIGNSVIALVQVVLYAGVGLLALAFSGQTDLLSAIGPAALWFVLFFTIGFVALSALYAVAGALSSRTEDVQSTSSPITMLLVGVYIASFTLKGTALTIASFVPVVSVIAMPTRLLQGAASWWEPVLALAVMIAFTAMVILVAERIYRRALLQTGSGKLSWREGLRQAN